MERPGAAQRDIGLPVGHVADALRSLAGTDRQTRRRSQEARFYVVASLILGAIEPAVEMARRIEDAGIRVLEFNVGVPYASQAKAGNVATELSPERLAAQVAAVRAAVTPLWVKTSGQSDACRRWPGQALTPAPTPSSWLAVCWALFPIDT